MNVIANSTLLARRIAELQRRRGLLSEKQERLRQALPEWTFAPLKLVGMTAEEIRSMMSDLSDAERAAGLDEIERDLERLDAEIEDAENALLAVPATSLDAIQAVLDLAVGRFRAATATDPNDVFYDYGDARVLLFLERAAEDLRSLLHSSQRVAS
jgi:predicted ATPase